MTVIDVPGRYRVERVTLDGLVVIVEAQRTTRGASLLVADGGRGNLSPDVSPGQSVPILIDLPASGVADADRFGLTLALGSSGGFKPTAVTVEANGQPLAALRIDRPAVTGVATSVLASGPTAVIDRINSVDVQLSNRSALLYHADDDALAMGANAMLVGQELVQYGRATALGGGAYRLSSLLRGHRGSEFAVARHVNGERIVLLDAARLVHVGMDPAMLGAYVVARAFGAGDDDANPPSFALRASGESLRPMSPCHFGVEVDAASYTLRWVARRTNSLGWSANSGDESGAASFEVSVRRGGGALKRVTTGPTLILPIADVAALGSGPIEFELIEQGIAASRPVLLTFNA